MNPSSSDWLWLPDQGLYWSPSSQSYARPNPHNPTGYDWFPVQQQQQQQGGPNGIGYQTECSGQNGSHSPFGYGQQNAVAGSSRNGSGNENGNGHAEEKEAEGEGIGGVGWGLDFDIPGDEKKKEPSNSAVPKTTAAGPSRATTTDSSQPTSSKPARILRLVKFSSPSSPLPPNERIALLDSRPGGYVLGRDKNPSRAVLRLKELAVSKTHAIVWFGRRDVEWDELFEGEEGDVQGEGGRGGAIGGRGKDEEGGGGGGHGEGDERRFWIVDCGSTHGTFLLTKPEVDASLPKDSKRLSPSRHASSPYPITHLSRITIGNTTFECHLHPDWPCEDCALDDPASGIMILHPEAAAAVISSSATTSSSAPVALLNNGDPSAVGPLSAGWKETEARRVALTAEAKRADTHRRSALAMKKLRESYFGGGGAAGAGGDGEREKEKAGASKGGGKRKWAAGGSDEGWKKKKGNEHAQV